MEMTDDEQRLAQSIMDVCWSVAGRGTGYFIPDDEVVVALIAVMREFTRNTWKDGTRVLPLTDVYTQLIEREVKQFRELCESAE